MNVLIITFDPPQEVGGIENRARLYLRGLKKKGHNAYLISFVSKRYQNPDRLQKGDGLTVSLHSLNFFLTLINLLSFLKRMKIEAIFMLTGCLTLPGIYILAYAKFARIRTTALLYGKDILSARIKLTSEHFLLPLALKLARRVAVNSMYTASLLGNRVTGKTVILYPCIDPYEMQLQSSHRKATNRIIFVGRLVRRKGVDDLIKAFYLVSKEFPDATLSIVGDGPELNNLRNIVSRLSLTNKVTFHGQLRGRLLYEVISGSNLLVLPSKTLSGDVEGFGTVILEAAFYSIPSIGTYSGGIKEAIIDGVTGKLVPESNPTELSKAICYYLNNPQIIRRHGQEARRRVLSGFILDNSVELIISSFK
ncbi:MAG: glycosyltransferase family 4 protein [Conexivisphaerales archaeon]